MNNNFRVIFLLISQLSLVSCAKDKGSLIKKEAVCESPKTVSYNLDIQPIFNEYCATAGCHSGNNPQGNLDLQPTASYSQLMNPSSGYVDTLNPKFSLLYTQMNSASNPMPPTGKLDKCKIEMILKWIEQKAKNN
jgi:hypothetical protein